MIQGGLMDLSKKGFQQPEKIYFDSESLTNTYGKLYAEAFETGFGTTLGNALRRILLSSIEGAAVTSIRIPGVLHEFSTMPGIKEDITNIVLNVKQLSFKLYSDKQTLSLKMKGPGDVTGKDITGDNFEILTPDQHIATLGKKVNLTMELTVEKGKGYVTADTNKDEDQPVDTMTIDAIFTPIKKINYWVEGARVGRSTDYDKLIMEIWTDGSITPQKAVTDASQILTQHLSFFSLDGESAKEEVEETVGAGTDAGEIKSRLDPDIFDDDAGELNEHLIKSVEELELSVRSYNCLKNANIRTLADLVQRTEQEMLRTKNFGRKSLNEIKEIIVSMGLHFNMRVDVEGLQQLADSKRPGNAS
jgi:DNA-directed RNA polymerase subunit alpha